MGTFGLGIVYSKQRSQRMRHRALCLPARSAAPFQRGCGYRQVRRMEVLALGTVQSNAGARLETREGAVKK